jgi:hypothetical protein
MLFDSTVATNIDSIRGHRDTYANWGRLEDYIEGWGKVEENIQLLTINQQ